MTKVEIREARCKGCELCIGVCPRKCLVMAKALNVRGFRPVGFDESSGECSGCMNCVLMCPDMAIEVIEDEDG